MVQNQTIDETSVDDWYSLLQEVGQGRGELLLVDVLDADAGAGHLDDEFHLKISTIKPQLGE